MCERERERESIIYVEYLLCLIFTDVAAPSLPSCSL